MKVHIYAVDEMKRPSATNFQYALKKIKTGAN